MCMHVRTYVCVVRSYKCHSSHINSLISGRFYYRVTQNYVKHVPNFNGISRVKCFIKSVITILSIHITQRQPNIKNMYINQLIAARCTCYFHFVHIQFVTMVTSVRNNFVIETKILYKKESGTNENRLGCYREYSSFHLEMLLCNSFSN